MATTEWLVEFFPILSKLEAAQRARLLFCNGRNLEVVGW